MNPIVLFDNNRYYKDRLETPANVFSATDTGVKALIENFKDVHISELCQGHNSVLTFPDDIIGKNEDPCLFEIKRIKDENNNIINYRFYTDNLMGFVSAKNKKNNKRIHTLKICSRFDNIQNKEESKDYFLQYILQRVYSFNFFKDLDFSKDPKVQAFDWLMLMFPHYLKSAYAQGLFRAYRTYYHNDANVRGTIDVPRHLRQNIPFQGKVAFNTREYTRDNYLMQLIRHTIECIDSHKFGRNILRTDSETREAVDVVRQYTCYIPNDRPLIISQNSKPVSHPFYTAYKELQDICLKILRHERIGYGNDKDTVYGMIFDGAWLWEEYIAVVIKDMFKHYITKNKDFYLFRKKENDGGWSKPFQQIVPDYVGTINGKTVIADAKYIPLYGRNTFPAERASEIYYKTLMYMYRFKTDIGFLFYPYSTKDENITDEEIDNLRSHDIEFSQPEKKDDKVVFETFKMDGDNDCRLYKVGFKIPESENATFSDFVKGMQDEEKEYRSKIYNIITQSK